MHISTHRSLAEIANIRTGFTFRGKIEEVPKGNAHILQIKDARIQKDESGSDIINATHLPQINWEGKNNALVDQGTVLLPSRGGYFRSSVLTGEESTLPLVASSQFILISPATDEVLSEFLCWSLNQPRMQRYLEEIASQGSSIPMLSTSAAKELKIEIPNIETQYKILQLNKLWEQEQQLTQALLNNRETMLQGMFQQLLKEKN
ncbi:restriction endonuclease subunit S [Thalassolituus sp. HI0120]|nr:restriction endonuclease subunit S [Thalassolituus sp. HI0120]